MDKSPLWDDGSCRYNPVASLFYKSHDCETQYSHCIWANDTCLWEPSSNYNLCYNAREAVWRHRNKMKRLAADVPKTRPRCKSSATRYIRRCAAAKERRRQKKQERREGQRPPVKYLQVLLNGYTTRTALETSTAFMEWWLKNKTPEMDCFFPFSILNKKVQYPCIWRKKTLMTVEPFEQGSTLQ